MLLVSLFGCSGRPYDVAPVAGLVTLDGKPLAGGVVSFQPIAAKNRPSPGPGSTGRLDRDGRFVLELLDRSPGAVVGEHRVRIYSVSAEGPAAGAGAGPLQLSDRTDDHRAGGRPLGRRLRAEQ